MQSTTQKASKLTQLQRVSAFVLVLVLLLQTLFISASAVAQEIELNTGTTKNPTLSVDGIGDLTQSELSEKLRNEILASMKENLVQRIDDNELSGPVSVIITFSDNSIISSYSGSKYEKSMTYEEYRATKVAKELEASFRLNQNKVIERLLDATLVDEIRYTYTHLMDAAFVTTTYENIAAITKTPGVERVLLSNTYLPQEAVSNPVDVYETGIFNSGSVDYTGKGTLVAILDTGCDYAHSAFTTHVVQNPAYDRNYVEGLLKNTEAYKFSQNVGHNLEAREVYYGNLTGEKIVFGYDYADKDPDIMPFENSHGTHVAGIIAGKNDKITGVAIDAQLAIMKVFSDYDTGAKDGDVIAALEDSIILGVDAINMSLGQSCGFTYESAADKQYKADVYSRVEAAGISLIVAASNDYSSGMGGAEGNTNKTENPDSATVGSPSTYPASLSVASINGKKENYMLINGETPIFFTKSSNNAAKEYDFFALLGIQKGDRVTYEYVTVPGVGMQINYAGIDVKGKIALVKRGDITFEEKVQFAQEAGAIAVIVYNNVHGTISMTIGNHAEIPAVSISKDDGEVLAAAASGSIEFSLENEAGPFMSDFSSWGPNPDLTLKPDITAHGGNILSSIVGNDYEEMSGTSMAAPNMCGITVLIRQYVNENFPQLTNVKQRDLVNQLCMSTATIALDKNGNPYSPRKQGAGIADIRKATTTAAYLFRDGHNRTKFELGDDPQRTGVYEMTVGIKNVSNAAVSYKLGAIVMTESVSTSDPEFVAEMAYLLNNTTEYIGTNCTINSGIVTVGAGETAYVTVTIKLSAEDKAYLNSTFENGMYVEGYVTFENTDENGVSLNAPFLAFYGDWGEAPIFDLDYYEVETEAHNNAIDDDDKIKADYYATTPLGSYYYDYIIPLGGYLYKMDESLYSPIPATEEKASLSYAVGTINGLFGVYTGLLRGAKELSIKVTNVATGEVIWQEIQYNCYKAHYSGSPIPYAAKIELMTVDNVNGTILGNNNEKFQVTMEAKLDWDGGENKSDSYSFSFYIDCESPTVTSYSFRTKYDKTRKENRYYLDLMIYDNHYAMSCRPIVIYNKKAESGNATEREFAFLTDDPIPIYQETRGTSTKVSFEITDYLDKIAQTDNPTGIGLYIDDYALNYSLNFIPFPGTENEQDVEFTTNEITLKQGETFDLKTLLAYKDTAEEVELDYLKNLKWEIKSGNSFIKMSGGNVEALNKAGTAVVRVTSDSWGTLDSPIYKTITVKVSSEKMEDNPDGSMNVLIEDLSFSHYITLFAHNDDIDFSEIGQTGDLRYLKKGTNSLSCYPGESFQLFYLLEPWNLDPSRYTLEFQSSNSNVASVDENGVVKAYAKGKARITLIITVDGEQSLLRASLSLDVKSEFIIENRTLVAYKGVGGVVEIPDDEGILWIGAFAFSHYNLNNAKDVPKDEDGYYDFDEKKEALGNNTVTQVIIPDGVETIQKYAFYNCTALEKVVLPDTCKLIEKYAFTKCKELSEINFDNVKVVAEYAFQNCVKLGTNEINTDRLYSTGHHAFDNTGFTSLNLPGLSRIGDYAFANCKNLVEVTLGERTRVSKGMFQNTPIEEITIYSDTIADEAFKNCTKLKTVTLKSNLTYLGKTAFQNCTRLDKVTFEGECEEIAAQAFYGCSALNSLTLPEGKVALRDEAFMGTSIRTLVFGETTELVSVGASVFSKLRLNVDCTKSTVYTVNGNAIYADDGATLVMVIPSQATATFTVPATVTKIASGAFSTLSVVTVNFASGSALEEIGDYAFANCTALSTITLPLTTTKIGDYAFASTTTLKNINLSKVNEIGDYAFSKSAITSVDLSTDNVIIGAYAFTETPGITSVVIGKDALIGESAFYLSSVVSVDLKGDATISNYAFSGCQNLQNFDFEEVTGKIGEGAFWACTSLGTVNAPLIDELGAGAFADCYALSTFTADNLIFIGVNAFGKLLENNYSSSLTSISLPKVEKIESSAFALSTGLQNVELPSLKYLGEFNSKGEVENESEYVFYGCTSLESITFSDELEIIPALAFSGCESLEFIDLSNIKYIGEGAFYSAALPNILNLDKVETVGVAAFFYDTENTKKVPATLECVNAPNLTYVDELAFASQEKLTTFNAPVLTNIGEYAFMSSGLVRFEVNENIQTIGVGAFQLCKSLTEFYYKKADGTESNTGKVGKAQLNDGALYLEHAKGMTLVCYPAAKEGNTLVVLEGTTRIEANAAEGNTSLVNITLPSTLKTIGDYAFYDCTNLKTVTFRSYHAPTLEGSLLGDVINITNSNRNEYTDFDALYRLDFTFLITGTVGEPLYYRTFIDTIGKNTTDALVAILPDNCAGYDSILYTTYFQISKETSGVTAGKFAVAFMDAVKELPTVADRFDKLTVEKAIVAYNALQAHKDELTFVTDNAIFERYNKAVSEYYVDIAEDKIAHLFDMAPNEYSFNAVKSALTAYNALNDAQRTQVTNGNKLTEKIAEINSVFGRDINFELDYEDNLPIQTQPDNGKIAPWVIVVIIIASLLVVGGGAVAVFFLLQKKRNTKAVEQTITETTAEEETEE